MVPVVLLGGAANALSVARSLGRLGVTVHVLTEPEAHVRYSRFARWISVPTAAGSEANDWAGFLLSSAAKPHHGSVLLSCSDPGIELIARHRDELSKLYLLDDSNPSAQLKMLGKLETYQAADAAGVLTPKYQHVESSSDLPTVLREMRFPFVVKPRLSHVFESRTGRKLYVVQTQDELLKAVEAISATGTTSLVVEMVPGNDDLLCSYYTYLDTNSYPMFHFTKRVIRRFPPLRGTACYHVTGWIPEAAELGAKLFQHVGLRGLANVEFKRDPRDGLLKLIECNARFTASNCLVSRSGFDLPIFVYNRLTGRQLPEMKVRQWGLTLWDPVRDFQAFLALRRLKQLNSAQWFKGICKFHNFPFFEWTDPMPALARLIRPIARRFAVRRGDVRDSPR